MRVVVVGATGNIGSAVLDLLAADEEIELVMALARRLPERSWPKTVARAFDLTRDDLRAQLAGAEAVVHLAWTFQPTRHPEVTWETNVRGSGRLFRACAEGGVRTLVYRSSVGAYSPAPGRVVDEDAPTDSLPTAGYGREKAYVERLLDTFEAAHPAVRVVRLRPAFVFQRSAGAEQRRLFAGPFVPTALLRPGALPFLPWPSGLHLQAVHARDVARAVVLALKRDVRGAFNLAASPVVHGAQMAELLDTRLVTLPPAVVRAGLAAAWHARLVPTEPALLDLAMGLPELAVDRARDELGWEPETSALAALGTALAGMADGAEGATPPLAAAGLRARLSELATGVGGRR